MTITRNTTIIDNVRRTKPPTKETSNNNKYKRRVSRVVKTPPFHGGNMGSTPIHVTSLNKMKGCMLVATIIDMVSDDEIISAYVKSSNYTNMARLLGYTGNISRLVRDQIRTRLNKLELPQFETGKNVREYTKGELIKRRKNYQSFRSDIRADARIAYEKSDRPKCCSICGYDKHYEVCHIKAVSDFSDDTPIPEINSISNLIALCPNHHWEFDNGILHIAG